ncbi:MAG: hypothetical protein ABR535_09715 [Pyrinomonadaceae bacterium]
MELLIPGLIVVALMVWASTKIKRAAAAAYESETITIDDFTIVKPEGFIHPINEDSPFVFEAYTKEFGAEPNENLPKVSAEVRRTVMTVSEVIDESRKSFDEISDQYNEGQGFIIEGIRGVYRVREKVIGVQDGALILTVNTLRENVDEYSREIKMLIESFETISFNKDRLATASAKR